MRPTAIWIFSPTTTEPWPRISAAGCGPSLAAREAPSTLLRTSMSLPCCDSRMSQLGMPRPMKAAMWKMGRKVQPVQLNGTTECEWLCTMAITSGRAL